MNTDVAYLESLGFQRSFFSVYHNTELYAVWEKTYSGTEITVKVFKKLHAEEGYQATVMHDVDGSRVSVDGASLQDALSRLQEKLRIMIAACDH